MIIPGENETFCNVDLMHSSWSVLDARFFIGDEIFYVSGRFIVKFLELRKVAADSEV